MALELLTDDQTFEICDTELENIQGKADPDVFYTLRPVPIALNRQTQKKHTKVTRPNGIREEVFDREAFLDDLLDYALVSWTGILLNGKPAECVRDLKIRGLDWPRKLALLAVAGINRAAEANEARALSFRKPA
jgi:hypothetical protein